MVGAEPNSWCIEFTRVRNASPALRISYVLAPSLRWPCGREVYLYCHLGHLVPTKPG
jgi:hypothetical protein